MPYYKDIANNDMVYWIDDIVHESGLPTTCVRITDEEADTIRAQQQAIRNEAEQLRIVNISPRQIRMAMTQMGLRETVEAVIAAGDQDLKDWYQFSTYFDRNHPQVIAMATALNVSDAQLDALWLLGKTL